MTAVHIVALQADPVSALRLALLASLVALAVALVFFGPLVLAVEWVRREGRREATAKEARDLDGRRRGADVEKGLVGRIEELRSQQDRVKAENERLLEEVNVLRSEKATGVWDAEAAHRREELRRSRMSEPFDPERAAPPRYEAMLELTAARLKEIVDRRNAAALTGEPPWILFERVRSRDPEDDVAVHVVIGPEGTFVILPTDDHYSGEEFSAFGGGTRRAAHQTPMALLKDAVFRWNLPRVFGGAGVRLGRFDTLVCLPYPTAGSQKELPKGYWVLDALHAGLRSEQPRFENYDVALAVARLQQDPGTVAQPYAPDAPYTSSQEDDDAPSGLHRPLASPWAARRVREAESRERLRAAIGPFAEKGAFAFADLPCGEWGYMDQLVIHRGGTWVLTAHDAPGSVGADPRTGEPLVDEHWLPGRKNAMFESHPYRTRLREDLLGYGEGLLRELGDRAGLAATHLVCFTHASEVRYPAETHARAIPVFDVPLLLKDASKDHRSRPDQVELFAARVADAFGREPWLIPTPGSLDHDAEPPDLDIGLWRPGGWRPGGGSGA